MSFQTTSKTIFQQSTIVRNIVNAKFGKNSSGFLMKEYLKLLSSIDVIEDCQCAVDRYKTIECPSTLDLTGLLQSLFMQQDAINSINTTLDPNGLALALCNKEFGMLAAIREIRNDVIGHPTNRGGGKDARLIRWLRHSIKKDSFSYVVISNETETRHVNVNQIIDDQESIVIFCLSKIACYLRGIDPEALLQRHLNCS